MPVDPLSLALMAVNVGASVFNNWRNNKQSYKLQEKQQEFARAAAERNKQRMWQLMREGQELALEMERETHKKRLEDIGNDFDRILDRLAYIEAIETWPLKVLPIVMKNQSLGSLTATADENIAMHCILTPSNCVQFNKHILPTMEEKLADFCNLHWSTLSSHPILFYSGAWETGTTPTGIEVSQLKTNLSNLPTLLITPFFKPEGGIVFQINAWGIGVELETEIECADFSYAESYKQGIDYIQEDDIKERTIEEFVPYLQCLIGYIADQYFWTNHNESPLLPTLLAMNVVNTDGMPYLKTISKNRYNVILNASLENTIFIRGNMALLKSIAPLIEINDIRRISTELFYKYCSTKESVNEKLTIEEILAGDDYFSGEDYTFLKDFSAIYKPLVKGDKYKLKKTETQIKKQFNMDSKKYVEKRDELINIINETVNVDSLPEIDKINLEAIKTKCLEGQFNIVLIGEFQGGKSTTFNAFCDGREISPRGFGLKTSACRISASNLSDKTKEEYAFISWKTNQQLLMSINNLLKKHIKRDEDLGLQDTDVRELYEILDLGNEEHCDLIKKAIEVELERNHRQDHTDELDLCSIARIIIHYHNSEKLEELREQHRFSIEDVARFVTFPEKFNSILSDGFNQFSFEDFIFAFIADVECYIHSNNLQRLGCTIVDCPGLFASAWDTQVAFETLRNADAVIYLLTGAKEMPEGDEKALSAIKAFNSTAIEDKLFVTINTRKGENSTSKFISKDREKLTSIGFDNVRIHKFNAQLMFLSEFAGQYISDQQDKVSIERFIATQRSNDIQDINDDIEKIWRKSVNRCYTALALEDEEGEYLKVSDLSKENINDALKFSNASEFLSLIEDFVVKKKAYSILVESGANNVISSLNMLCNKLQRQQEDSNKSIAEVEAELHKVENDFEKQKNDILEILEEEDYDGDVVKPIAENGFNVIFTKENIEKTALNIVLELQQKLCFAMKAKLLQLKAMEKLNIFDNKQEEIRNEIENIVKKIFDNNYKTIFESAIKGWIIDIEEENNDAYKSFAIGKFKSINREIQRCWKQGNNNDLRDYEFRKLPDSLKNISLTLSDLSTNSNMQNAAEIMADKTTTLAMNSVVTIVISTLMSHLAAYIALFVAEFFTGTIMIQLAISAVGALSAFAFGIKKGTEKTLNALSDAETKLYSEFCESLNKSITENKNNMIAELSKIPLKSVEVFKRFHTDELAFLEGKIKQDVEDRRKAKHDFLHNHSTLIQKFEKIRGEQITPILGKLEAFIDSCCI